METDPLHENIKITFVKNFPALFGIAMIGLYKYAPNHLDTLQSRLPVLVLVCAFTCLYANVVLSEFDKEMAKRLFFFELWCSVVFMVNIYLWQSLDSLQSYLNNRKEIWWVAIVLFLTVSLVGFVAYLHRDLFSKKVLHQWRGQLSGLTCLTCLAAVHMGYLYCTSGLKGDTSAWVSNLIIHCCSSFIVLVSIFDTLQLSSAATKDTWKGWFISHCCTYWPGILYLSYAIAHIWQTSALSDNTQKITFSLLFFLLLTGFKQLKVTAQEGGELRFSPIAIDHNLLAKDLCIALLLPFVYHTKKDDTIGASKIPYEDIAMSVLCTLIVRWGLCSGLITHLTKKPTKRSSKLTPRAQSSNRALWMRRAVHGILVSTCWLLMKEKTISNITMYQWLTLTSVATGALVLFSWAIAYRISPKYISWLWDVLYYNQNTIIISLIMACVLTKSTPLNGNGSRWYVAAIILLIPCFTVCTLWWGDIRIQKKLYKILTHCAHCALYLLVVKRLGESYGYSQLVIGCILLALTVEALHPVPNKGQVDDIKYGALTRMDKGYLLLGALYGLVIAIVPDIYHHLHYQNGEDVNLFTYKTLICVMVGVLISFLGAVYGEEITVWLGWQDDRNHTAVIQALCMCISGAIAIYIQLLITVENYSLIQIPYSLILLCMPWVLIYSYEFCTKWMAKQQRSLSWLFRWTRADALVDYVPFTSRNEYKY